MAPKLEFYFDYTSPYTYFAATQVQKVAAAHQADLVYKPFLLGALFKAIGAPVVPVATFTPTKQRYQLLDLHRCADWYDVPFAFPKRFPVNSIAALRLTLAAEEQAAEPDSPGVSALINGMFKAYWVDGQDIADPAVLTAMLEQAQLPTALLDKTQDPAIKEQLKICTQEAVDRGVCGAPTFAVGDLLFWGQDRLPFVERALDGWVPRLPGA